MPDQNLHAVPPEEPSDPFDVEKIREASRDDLGVERVTLAIPVRRPGKVEFFRVHPDPEFSVDWYVLEREDGIDREVYWVTAEYRAALLDEIRPVRLFTCINKHGTVFLWPAKLPGDSSSGRRWAESALEVAEEAKTLWVKLLGRRDLGAYDLFKAMGDLGEPQWPEGKTLRDFLKLAFKGDRVIDSLDHPVLRELSGEM